jgi:uncharacterized protein YndB with AHSA1/START domain
MEQTPNMSRTFDAPRSLVWEAWADPAHARAWFGPRCYTCPVHESDLRTGGAVYYEMQAPDGPSFPSRGVYEDVIRPERIVLRDSVEFQPAKTAFEARTTGPIPGRAT